MMLIASQNSFAGWTGASSVDGKPGTWQEVHCEEGTGWQKCQPPPCEAQGVSWGGCSGTLPRTLLLGSVTVSNTRSGYTGSATYQCRDYDLYSQWTFISGSCAADPPPPSSSTPNPGTGTGPAPGGPAQVGTTYRITAMICSVSDANYWTDPADTPAFIRDSIIGQYRSWEGARCPEASGFINWVGYVNMYAYQLWGGRPGVPDFYTYDQAYNLMTKPAINAGAEQTGEKTAAGVAAANHLCQLAATEKYGPSAQAEYVLGSGNQCTVTVI